MTLVLEGISVTTTTAPATGFFWHIHHNTLVEWCYNYQERVDYILLEKPVEEQPLRLRLSSQRRTCQHDYQARTP
jgi:hypothetical protein